MARCSAFSSRKRSRGESASAAGLHSMALPLRCLPRTMAAAARRSSVAPSEPLAGYMASPRLAVMWNSWPWTTSGRPSLASTSAAAASAPRRLRASSNRANSSPPKCAANPVWGVEARIRLEISCNARSPPEKPSSWLILRKRFIPRTHTVNPFLGCAAIRRSTAASNAPPLSSSSWPLGPMLRGPGGCLRREGCAIVFSQIKAKLNISQTSGLKTPDFLRAMA